MHRHLRIRQFMVVLTLVAGLIAATASVDPVASAAPVASKVNSEVFVDPAARFLMDEQGISQAEAEKRLSWHARIPALEVAALAQLGANRYGGVWVDADDGDRVKLAVVPRSGEAIDATSVETEGAAVITQVGLSGAADVVSVAHSYAELKAESQRAAARLVEDRASGGPHLVSAGPDPVSNEVVLTFEGTRSSEESTLDAIDSIQQELGDMLRVEYGGNPITEARCSGSFCDPPIRGGVRIDHVEDGRTSLNSCSAGFVMYNRTTGEKFLTTAGHCGARLTRWATRYAGATRWSGIGSIIARDSAGAISERHLDVAFIRFNGGSFSQTKNWIYINDPDYYYEQYQIVGQQYSYVNGVACNAGYVTGISCGRTTAVDKTADRGFGRYLVGIAYADYCTQKMDSGGPVFNSDNHAALGLVVGYLGSNNCQSAYQQINDITARYNNVVVRS